MNWYGNNQGGWGADHGSELPGYQPKRRPSVDHLRAGMEWRANGRGLHEISAHPGYEKELRRGDFSNVVHKRCVGLYGACRK